MNDDYLWDGSGEPDPEIQNLENILRPYRHHRPAPEMPARRHLPAWTRMAAAALLLVALAGLWLATRQNHVEQQPGEQAGVEETAPAPPSKAGTPQPPEPPQPAPAIAAATKPGDRKPDAAPKVKRAEPKQPAPAVVEAAPQVATVPFFDTDLTRHFEKARLLLLSFRNIPAAGGAADVAYERAQSRRLLERNVELRREAQAKGNLPAEELLGSLEPLLLDIANLPDRPAAQDVNTVKDLVQKKEMVATLQVYAGPIVSRN